MVRILALGSSRRDGSKPIAGPTRLTEGSYSLSKVLGRTCNNRYQTTPSLITYLFSWLDNKKKSCTNLTWSNNSKNIQEITLR